MVAAPVTPPGEHLEELLQVMRVVGDAKAARLQDGVHRGVVDRQQHLLPSPTPHPQLQRRVVHHHAKLRAALLIPGPQPIRRHLHRRTPMAATEMPYSNALRVLAWGLSLWCWRPKPMMLE